MESTGWVLGLFSLRRFCLRVVSRARDGAIPPKLTHWPLGDLDAILKLHFSNLVLLIGIFTSLKDNALRWMPWDHTDDKSTLVQVVAWCCEATSHYLSQCWPSCMSPYGVTRPQWITNFSPKFWKEWGPMPPYLTKSCIAFVLNAPSSVDRAPFCEILRRISPLKS